jgi:peptide-N4-(N-acetyl-beta-glucosaminyl)asparagine amidase
MQTVSHSAVEQWVLELGSDILYIFISFIYVHNKCSWVNDNLDHVWVEIWADDLSRWIHCDPCENVIDTPLMYDKVMLPLCQFLFVCMMKNEHFKGWGKKHAYVFAFAVDHMQDVTWRYCFNHSAVMKRRKSCREQILRNFVSVINGILINIDIKYQHF